MQSATVFLATCARHACRAGRFDHTPFGEDFGLAEVIQARQPALAPVHGCAFAHFAILFIAIRARQQCTEGRFY